MTEILSTMDWESFMWGVAATFVFGCFVAALIGILGEM
jgi:hypothetical protein